MKKNVARIGVISLILVGVCALLGSPVSLAQAATAPIGVTSVALSVDGSQAITGNADGSAVLWDVQSGKILYTLRGQKDKILGVAFSLDGKQTVTGSADTTAWVWNVNTGRRTVILSGSQDRILSVAFSPDGTQVVAGAADGTTLLWDATSGKQLNVFSGERSQILTVTFLNKTQVFTADANGTGTIWDAAKGSKTPVTVQSFARNQSKSAILNVALVPNNQTASQTVLAGIADGSVWQVTVAAPASGSTPAPAEIPSQINSASAAASNGTNGQILSIAFSPNGSQMLTGSADGSISLVKIPSMEAHPLVGQKGQILSATFSHDGTQVFTGSSDGTAFLWNTSTLKMSKSFVISTATTN